MQEHHKRSSLGAPGLLPLMKNRPPVSPAGRKRRRKRQASHVKDVKNSSGNAACMALSMKYEPQNNTGQPGVRIM